MPSANDNFNKIGLSEEVIRSSDSENPPTTALVPSGERLTHSNQVLSRLPPSIYG